MKLKNGLVELLPSFLILSKPEVPLSMQERIISDIAELLTSEEAQSFLCDHLFWGSASEKAITYAWTYDIHPSLTYSVGDLTTTCSLVLRLVRLRPIATEQQTNLIALPPNGTQSSWTNQWENSRSHWFSYTNQRANQGKSSHELDIFAILHTQSTSELDPDHAKFCSVFGVRVLENEYFSIHTVINDYVIRCSQPQPSSPPYWWDPFQRRFDLDKSACLWPDKFAKSLMAL